MDLNLLTELIKIDELQGVFQVKCKQSKFLIAWEKKTEFAEFKSSFPEIRRIATAQ